MPAFEPRRWPAGPPPERPSAAVGLFAPFGSERWGRVARLYAGPSSAGTFVATSAAARPAFVKASSNPRPELAAAGLAMLDSAVDPRAAPAAEPNLAAPAGAEAGRRPAAFPPAGPSAPPGFSPAAFPPGRRFLERVMRSALPSSRRFQMIGSVVAKNDE